MSRIRWYGPAVVLVVTVLGVMLVGPGMVRHLAWAEQDAKIQLIRQDLAGNASLAQLSDAFRQVAKVVEPSVVSIQVATRHVNRRALPEDEMRRFFGPRFFGPMTPPDQGDDENQDESPQHSPRQTPQDESRYDVPQPFGSGSGWVYDVDGHIVTNNHVVADADVITVRFQDGSERNATIVARDPKTDVAVIKVEGGDLHPAAIADLAKNPVEQGDIVFAFGSPFRFEFSMSQGIISAKGRQLGIVDVERDPHRGMVTSGYENFLQTDAAINPGNSGGPLTNVDGQVIGMNTAIASSTGSYNGIGFAIPIDMVDSVVRELIKSGHITRGYLGIVIKDLTPDAARNFGIKGKGVLVVDAVEGGAADKAGIKPEDVITKVNGKAMTTTEELRSWVAAFKPGEKITIEYYRDGKPETTTATVAEQPDSLVSLRSGGGQHPSADKSESKGVDVLRRLGLDSLLELTPDAAARMEVPMTPGVLVRRVRQGSEAASKRITPGTVITRVMGVAVRTPDEVLAVLEKHDLSKGVRLTVMHGDEPDIVVLEVPK